MGCPDREKYLKENAEREARGEAPPKFEFKRPTRAPFARSRKEAPLELALVRLCIEKRMSGVCTKKIDEILRKATEEITALQKE